MSLFKKQMKTIATVVVIMIAIPMIATYLKTYGLSKLFTIKSYQEAFRIADYDKFMINITATGIEIMAMFGCYIELQYNKEMADIEREERIYERRYEND